MWHILSFKPSWIITTIHLLQLLCILCLLNFYTPVDGEVYGDHCSFALVTQVVEIDTLQGPVEELHIRQNIQGSLEIRDGNFGDNKLRLDIEKSAPSESQLDYISINHTTFNAGKGKIHVLQISYKEESKSIVSIAVGSSVAVSLCLALCAVLGWWFWKKRDIRFSPARRLRGIADFHGLQRNGTIDTVVSEEAEDRHNVAYVKTHCEDDKRNIELVQSSSFSSCHYGDHSSVHKHSYSSLRKSGTTDITSSDSKPSPLLGATAETTLNNSHNLSGGSSGNVNGLVREDSTESPRSFIPRCYDNEVVTTPTTPNVPEGGAIGSNDQQCEEPPRSSEDSRQPAATPAFPSNYDGSNYEPLQRRRAGGGTGSRHHRGSPTPLSKTTVAMFTVVTLVSLVYASCPTVPKAHIVLFVPPAVKLGILRVFYQINNNNDVITDRWMLKNFTNLQVFDLKDAGPTRNAPCFSIEKCSLAHHQNLAGCDAAANKCLCMRGYTMYSQVCVDEDECETGRHTCPSSARCVNTIGGFLCHCGDGYYGTTNECKVCSVGCPPDHFEAKMCTNFGDRICKPCQKCEGAFYEKKSCTITSDRECIHAAHPLLMDEEDTMPTFLEGLKVNVSSNVISEDLHHTKDLKTTSYVTDQTQASDFKWERESGIVVNTGILNVHLIPKYEDVTHESDNEYMIKNPSNSQDKLKFQKIVDNYCRNPIPDYYSITLEIARDRLTQADMKTCSNKNPALPNCPPGQIDGDTYLHRSLNGPCTKMGTFPEPLTPAANSIVCTDQTSLLSDVFNRSYSEEQSISFPNKKCRIAQTRCNQCMKQFNCEVQDIFRSKCCQIDCYTLPFCKQAMSPECVDAPTECAMGNAYRYTIQPVFQKIMSEFKCHIKHKPSDILYQLFFSLELPAKEGSNKPSIWATKPVYKTVYAKDLNYESKGEFQVDYLTIEHNTGIDLEEEFLLVGRDIMIEDKPTINYTVHPVKKTTEDKHKRKSTVHRIDHNIYVATTEFNRPFDYSTSKWVKNNECHKDVSKFNFYNKDASHPDPVQDVKVVTQSNKLLNPFKYWLQQSNNPPYMRFTIPGNMSILPWYFKKGSGQESELFLDHTLKIKLILASAKMWLINIEGRISRCPGYLGIKINDRREMEELILQDLLILCPTHFNLTYHLPNIGQKVDKTFDIHFTDSLKVYHTFLTQLQIGPDQEVTEPEPVVLLEAKEVSYKFFVIIAGIGLLIIIILNKVYLYTEVIRTKKKVFHNAKRHINPSNIDTLHHNNDTTASCGKNMNKGQMIFLIIYVVLRVIYSLLFTFTVFFALLMIFVRSDLNNLSKIDDFVQTAKNHSHFMSRDIDRHWKVELLRQAEKVTSMQGACSNYVTELFDSMAFQMNNITSAYYSHELYGSKTSLSYLMNQRAQHKLNKLYEDIKNYTQTHKEKLSLYIVPAINKYNKFLKMIFKNDWLVFSQKLFNDSDFRPRNRNLNLKDSLLLSGIETDFVRFLEIEDVDFVRMWALRYWERYEQMLPEFPSLPIPIIEPQHIHCIPKGQKSDYNITRQPSITHMDTVKFFAPNLPADVDKGPVYHHGDIVQEYKFVTKETTTTQPKHVEPLATEQLEITNMIDTEILSIIFLILDAILLLYRFSHTYLNASLIVKGFNEEINKQQIEEQEYYTRPVMPAVTASTPVTSKYKQTCEYSHIPMGQPNVDTSSYQYDYHGNGPPNYHGNGMGTKPNSSSNDGVYYISGGRTDFCKIVTDVIAKIMLSNSLPKLLIGCCLLVLVYGVMKVVCVVAEMKFILDSNILATYTSGMDVQINQTNWYLSDQASYFNDVSMNIYQGQMRSELRYLQSMMQYFDLEQNRLVDNYKSEGCNITREITSTNWTCDIDTEAPSLNIPLLPCNFIPILPNVFPALAPVELEQKLVKTLEPYIVSSRQVAIVLSYIIFISLAAIIIIHIAGVVIFHYLKSSQKFTVRRVYVTSYLPHGGEELPPPPTEESDYESDDIEGLGGGSGWSHNTLPKHRSSNERYMRTYPSPSRGKPNPDPTGTLLNDFKYSETKV